MNSYIRGFHDDFEAIVAMHGERTALISAAEGQPTLTYKQLGDISGRYIKWLETMGIRPGDRVGAVLPNSLEMLALFVACLRGGVGFAPLACDTSRLEAETWVSLIRPSVIVMSSILPAPVTAGIRASAVRCVELDTDGTFAFLPSDVGASDSSPSSIFLFTSGTTGVPKAIVVDRDRLWASGQAFLRFHGVTTETSLRIWNYLPQSYLGGLFNLCLIPMSVAGAIVVDESFSGTTFLRFWQTVDRYDINALWLVPTIVRGLLSVGERTKRYAAKSYKDAIPIAFLGTAPIELATKQRFEEVFGVRLLENYALSETTFLTSEKAGDPTLRREGSVGNLLPYAKVAFRPVGGDSNPHFSEILVRSPFLFEGYLDANQRIDVNTEDGYFATGDLGYLADDGQLILTGRCKDIIKKGGQFVSLAEIEVLVAQHEAVEVAVATPVPHKFYGESYVLFVKLTLDAPPDALGALQRYVYENLAKYKWPEKIEVVTDFQQTGSGKIRKFLLQSRES